jgi:hypothetical protein
MQARRVAMKERQLRAETLRAEKKAAAAAAAAEAESDSEGAAADEPSLSATYVGAVLSLDAVLGSRHHGGAREHPQLPLGFWLFPNLNWVSDLAHRLPSLICTA